MAMMLFNLQQEAKAAASQMLPSADSPSPITQKTLLSSLSQYMLEQAIPAEKLSPIPKDPVATSTNGMEGTGCPCNRASFFLTINNSSLGITPDLARQAYKMGAACPLERINLSLRKLSGLSGKKWRPFSWKNSEAITSAMDAQEVGCPVLVMLVMLMESILSRLAISCRSSMPSFLTCFLGLGTLPDFSSVTAQFCLRSALLARLDMLKDTLINLTNRLYINFLQKTLVVIRFEILILDPSVFTDMHPRPQRLPSYGLEAPKQFLPSWRRRVSRVSLLSSFNLISLLIVADTFWLDSPN